MKLRAHALPAIERSSFDLCVIGGGATGAGCALDAQLRGLRTVLLEAGDFASGASGASTKMVHGGVRYLEQAIRRFDAAELSAVRRALRERVRMLRNAPFLTREVEFVTPCFSRRDLAYFGLGLKLYDLMAGRARLAPSRFLSRDAATPRLPLLRAANLAGAVAYTDGQFDDARYNIALVETFCVAGGETLNHARVVGLEKDVRGRIAAARVEAEGVDGEPLSRRQFAVRARAFVNATGANADSIRQMASYGIAPRIRPSQGVHIVLRAESWPYENALLIPRTEDGRVIFAIPWQRRLLVGTTDRAISPGEEPHVTQEDVEYLLRHLNPYLSKPLTTDEITGAFVGVRPLVTSHRASGSKSKPTKQLARDHEVELDPSSGLISIMGGKWTTYRAMAEETVDMVQRHLAAVGITGRSAPIAPCSTRNHPLVGAEGYTPDLWNLLANEFSVPERVARRLAERYGDRARQVAALAASHKALTEPLAPGALASGAEVVFAIRCEMASSIEDVLARRLGIEPCDWRETLAMAPAVADLLAREMGWPAKRRDQALATYQEGIWARIRETGIGAIAP